MKYVAPHLRTQKQILEDLKARLNDLGNTRWSDTVLYRTISDALLTWSGRVSIPYVYTITGGWVAGTYQYSIPDYMGTRLVPQRRVITPYYDPDSQSYEYVWADVLGWTLEPDGSGGQYLRTQWNEGTAGTTSDARILWWGENGYLPTVIPTVGTQIDSDDTSLVLDIIVDNLPQSGYVKVGNEWIQYAGYTDDGSATTLTNLVRGINNTTAATQTVSTTVHFGVAMPELRLLQCLYYQAMSNAFAYRLADTNETDRERYERNMGFYQQLADEFWKGWTPAVSPRMILTRRGNG